MGLASVVSAAACVAQVRSLEPIPAYPDPAGWVTGSIRGDDWWWMFRRQAPSFVRVTDADLIAMLPAAGTYWDDDETERSSNRELVYEMARRVESGSISSDEMREAMLRAGVLRSSPRWFRGRPYHVRFQLPEWLSVLRSYDAIATADVPGAKAAKASSMDSRCGLFGGWQHDQEIFQLIGELPEATESVSFTVHIKRNVYDRREGDIDNEWHFSLRLPVQLVDEAPPAPISDETTTQLVRAALGAKCMNGFFRDGPSACLMSHLKRPPTGTLDNIFVRAELKLVDVSRPRGERVLSTLLAEDPEGGASTDQYGKTQFVRGAAAADIVNRQELERFVVRVRGLPPGEEGNRWCREHYWAGAFEVPLREVLEAESGVRTIPFTPWDE